MSVILQAENLTKTYTSGDRSLTVLHEIDLTVHKGETLAIVGPSGSGKTTLLGLCAGLDRPTAGAVTLCGARLNDLTEDERARVRNQHVGFIFQNFQLIPTLTALENVMIPLELRDAPHADKTAKQMLDRVGLGDRLQHYPSQLSGGEQQRVSLARAFSNQPAVLFADEPTGNLDDDTGHTVERLMFDLNQEHQTTLIIVTHDLELAQKAGRIVKLRGGRIVSDAPVAMHQSAGDAL